MTMHESVNNIVNRMERMESLKLSVIFHLKNYLRMLETDDFDTHAVDKMKDVNDLISKLQEEM